ncbi:MAG: TVP38/TMEM64 family protein [Planctomycetia bacterium]
MSEAPSSEAAEVAPKASAEGWLPAALKLAGLVAFLGAALFLWRGTETGRAITPAGVVEYMDGFDPTAKRLVFVGFYAVGAVLMVPGTLLSFAGAVLFGAYEGTLWTWIGAVIGATLSFFVARRLGRSFVDRLLAGRFDAFDRKLRENGFVGLLVIRLLPIFPFAGVNFGSGLTSIRFKDYILATAVGILPGVFVYQVLFAKFGRKILVEGPKWSYFADKELWGAAALFVGFTAAVMIGSNRYKKWDAARKTRAASSPD